MVSAVKNLITKRKKGKKGKIKTKQINKKKATRFFLGKEKLNLLV